MTMMQILDGEVQSPAIEFSALLATGETLSSGAAVVADPTGELSLASAAISGTTVTFTADATSATVVGRRYEITGTVVTSTGRTLKEKATVALM